MSDVPIGVTLLHLLVYTPRASVRALSENRCGITRIHLHISIRLYISSIYSSTTKEKTKVFVSTVDIFDMSRENYKFFFLFF